MQNYELAENDYMSGMKYKDIAEKYGVSLATVKSWKTRYGWNRKGMHTKTEKSMHTKKDNIEHDKEPVADEIESVLQNTELTEKQRLFCLYFVKCFNATKAYRKAYQCDEYVAMSSRFKIVKKCKGKRGNRQIKTGKAKSSLFNTGRHLSKVYGYRVCRYGRLCYLWKEKSSGMEAG